MMEKYRAIGKNGDAGWYAVANVDMKTKRAVGTLYHPPLRGKTIGAMYKHFNVKVYDDGEFRVGFGGPKNHIRFRNSEVVEMAMSALLKLRKKVES